jgi:hypothetical protein
MPNVSTMPAMPGSVKAASLRLMAPRMMTELHARAIIATRPLAK